MSKRGIGSALTAGLFVLGIGGPARAARDLQQVTFKGVQVTADFAVSSNVTCADGSEGLVIANGRLTGAESIFAQTGLPTFMSNGVVVDLSYSNSCTGTLIGFASGGVPNALTPPDKKLTSAAMVGSGSVQDFGSGQTIPVLFNVTVAGDGDLSQSKSKGKSKSRIAGSATGPIKIISSTDFSNANRPGTATGTISIEGFAVNADFVSANMNVNDNTSRTITKL